MTIRSNSGYESIPVPERLNLASFGQEKLQTSAGHRISQLQFQHRPNSQLFHLPANSNLWKKFAGLVIAGVNLRASNIANLQNLQPHQLFENSTFSGCFILVLGLLKLHTTQLLPAMIDKGSLRRLGAEAMRRKTDSPHGSTLFAPWKSSSCWMLSSGDVATNLSSKVMIRL